jgi:flagellar protein FlgJ
MTAPVAWSDPTALASVRQDARKGDGAGLREVAHQFESLFLRMMLKSMREASSGDPYFDSNEGGMYRDMFDDQVAVDMSNKGGMGLADMLVRQLSKYVPGQVQPETKAAAAPDRSEFVQKMWPLAVEAGKRLGVDPRHVVAQAALESGWGEAAAGNNFFGIKTGSGWRGAALENQTQEFVNGAPVTVAAPFRAYKDVDASVADYVRLLGGGARYAAVRGTGSDTAAFTRAIQEAGYATDPDYAVKLRAVVQAVDGALPKTIKDGEDWPITPSTGSL